MSILDGIAKRKSVRVRLECLPEVEAYAASLTGIEFIALGEKIIKAGEDRSARRAAEMEAFLRDAEGKPLLADGEGLAFIERAFATDVQRIQDAGEELNNFSDKALEEASKN